MAAPIPTARQDPTGIMMTDGYRSLITFATDPDIELWEKGPIGAPGIDGGEAIETTTHHNDTYRTMASRALRTLTEFTFEFGYDPTIYTAGEALINYETTITRSYPDGSTLAFYGYLRMIEFADLQEGEVPTGTCTVTPTNFDPVNKVEAGPVMTSVAGT